MRRKRGDRWLSMSELASLLGLKQEDARARRRYVRRLIRGIEKRDGRSYLRRFGDGPGKLWIAVSTVERLLPWDAGTISAMRGDIDHLGGRMVRAEKKIAKHEKKIAKHELALRKYMELAGIMLGVGDQEEPKRDQN